MKKDTRNSQIAKATAALSAIQGVTAKELASGTSFFLTNAEKRTRIAKVVYTGRFEINVKLPEEAVTQLTKMNFQDWSNSPRSGVSYYGEATDEAIALISSQLQPIVAELNAPKADEVTAEPEAQDADDLSSIWPIVDEADEVSPEPEIEPEVAQEAEEISVPEAQLEADKPKAKGQSRKNQPKKKAA